MYEYFKVADYIKKDKKIAAMLTESNGIVTSQITDQQLSDRGISYNKNGEPVMNVNTFINYALKRVIARENKEGIWFYNFSKKHYDLLDQDTYEKIFFYIVEEASEDVWKNSMQKKYIAYLKNKVEQFNIDGNRPGFLQFNNYILDFTGEEITPYVPSSKDFCNFRIPYNYDPEANCPKFMKFLNEIFENDQERIDLIQEIMGACIYYENFMQKIVVFLGEGSNGKSVLASIISHMLGDSNTTGIALDNLSSGRFSKQNLDKKLLNISPEIKSEKLYSTADIKALTGGDKVEVEEKFKKRYTTSIHTKFIILANHMIQTEDDSEGFFRRIILIPFNQYFYDPVPDEDRDPEKLYKNPYLESELYEELPGIFNFALDGFIRLYNNSFSFTKSSVCEKAIEVYKNEQNVVKAFMNECIIITGIQSKKKVKSSELYPRFETFCKKNHYYRQLNNFPQNRFLKMFKNIIDVEGLDVVYKELSDNNYYVGIQFK